MGPINRIRRSGGNTALGILLFSYEVEPSLSALSFERGAMGCGQPGKIPHSSSDFTKETCKRLKDNGLDMEAPKYEPFVLINAGIRDDSPDIEPMLILNWQPPGRE